MHELTEVEREQVHECLLFMLKDFIYICEKYDLIYMLGGGSALGAVRHRGFIPWDDDLDINMPRKDYDKFIKIFYQEMANDYDISAPHTDAVEYPFIKIYKKGTVFKEVLDNQKFDGLWIDIFPIEYASNNSVCRYIKGYISDILIFINSSIYIARNRNADTKKMYDTSVSRKIRYYIAIIINYFLFYIDNKKLTNFYDKFVKGEENTNYVTVPTGRKHYLGECLKKDVLFPIRKAKFEGLEVNVYGKVEEYLTALYGDYMKIPPLDKREKHIVSKCIIGSNLHWIVTKEEG